MTIVNIVAYDEVNTTAQLASDNERYLTSHSNVTISTELYILPLLNADNSLTKNLYIAAMADMLVQYTDMFYIHSVQTFQYVDNEVMYLWCIDN